MKIKYKIIYQLLLIVCSALIITSCQKLERPALGSYPQDPPPPPYSTLKSIWSFENNLGDSGQDRSSAVGKNTSFVTGINGQAVKIGDGGYVLINDISDSIKNAGSFTIAFWMNGAGPVTGGAQGLFAISEKSQFWGNLEVFLENNDNGDEGFLKIHMLNANSATAPGEEWSEVKIPGLLNKWSHIAITYDSLTSKLNVYANGEATAIADKVLGGGSYGPVKFGNVGGMVLGSFAFQTSPSLTNHGPEEWAKSFNGALDQFRIYKTALSASEVNALFTGKL